MADAYSYIGGLPCLDFANARQWVQRWQDDGDYGELLRWSLGPGIVSAPEARRLQRQGERSSDAVSRVLARAAALSSALRQLFSAVAEGGQPTAADMAILNAEVLEAMSRARVEQVDGRFVWGWASEDTDLARVLWPIARSAADLLVSEDLAQVKTCAQDTCRWLFLDTSRNHGRRWCDMKVCGNRAKVRRYRARAH